MFHGYLFREMSRAFVRFYPFVDGPAALQEDFMNFDFNSFSIQDFLQKVQDFGYLKIGIIIGVLFLYLLFLGIAGKKMRVLLLLLAAVIAALFAYSGTRKILLDIPDRVSALVQQKTTGGKESTQATTAAATANEDGWVTVSSSNDSESPAASLSLSSVPPFSGDPAFDVSGIVDDVSVPEHTASYYSLKDLDSLGRCQDAYALLGPELLPTGERGDIGMVRPSGWHTVKYPDLIPDLYLYNRCHLLAYQETGLNDDERNLITGTRYMNVEGMEPYENKTTWYIKDTGNHVSYKVSPLYEGDNLVCSGVLMQAISVEDDGAGIHFNVFCYNVQPGIVIDYRTGESHAA